MNDDIDYIAHPFGVEIVGPFVEEWRVTVGGFRVPYITAIVRADGGVMLSLDERYLIDGDDLEVRKWLPFIAHAMAVAAGYSSHGQNSRVINPFRIRMSSLDTRSPEHGAAGETTGGAE